MLSPVVPLSVDLRHLGTLDVVAAIDAMQRFTATRDASTPDALWLVEHPPVFTLGQAARPDHVRTPGAIPVVATDRGGQVTYHGPGQVVVYVLVDLKRRGLFVREAVQRIEQAVIDVLAASGIAGVRIAGAPGVYVPRAEAQAPIERLDQTRKIAALGLKVKRGCTYHGVALNVDMDLAPFAAIDPCGYAGLDVTDMASSGARAVPAAVGERLADALVRQLARDRS